MNTVRCLCKYSLSVKSLQKISVRSSSTLKRRTIIYLKKHLLLVNSITSGLFMGIGDLIQQEIEHYYNILPKRYDWARAGRMFWAGCIIGPLHHVYYLKLDQYLPGSSLRIVFWKIVADQVIAAPLTYIAFFYSIGLLEKKPLQEATTELKNKFIVVYLGDWFFWPPVQFINFYYLPWQYRVIYINFATMIFNVFLSYIKHDVV